MKGELRAVLRAEISDVLLSAGPGDVEVFDDRIGLVHEPVGTLQNPDLVAAYEKLPQANGNLQQFVNLESLQLK